ncbi:hypothetical protein GCM10007414_34110 [Agarivorans gilvus]|uniref:Uncharacterized protein n=1 Tax=Agarivorans gilvus TaxID=680279 RepID=A0ABQ1I7K3_9ALTE|nr:hypothetical protein GCM10007414_34110 [Agarivorans gilvus]
MLNRWLAVSEILASMRFYDAIMAVLGHAEGLVDEKGRCLYLIENGVLV